MKCNRINRDKHKKKKKIIRRKENMLVVLGTQRIIINNSNNLGVAADGGGGYYSIGFVMSSFRSSRFLDDTFEQLAARSMSCSPICSYKLCMSFEIDALRMLPPAPVLPLIELSKFHNVGKTCNSICFCLRTYTLGITSIDKKI